MSNMNWLVVDVKEEWHVMLGSRDSSVVRVPDVWLKGCRFESLQKWQENFLLRGQLSVLTFTSVTVPLHPCVMAVACKRSWSFCKKCRLQLNTYALYICGFTWSDMVHGCMVYTECTETAAVLHGTSHVSAVIHHFGGYSKTGYKKLVTLAEQCASTVSLLESGK